MQKPRSYLAHAGNIELGVRWLPGPDWLASQQINKHAALFVKGCRPPDNRLILVENGACWAIQDSADRDVRKCLDVLFWTMATYLH